MENRPSQARSTPELRLRAALRRSRSSGEQDAYDPFASFGLQAPGAGRSAPVRKHDRRRARSSAHAHAVHAAAAARSAAPRQSHPAGIVRHASRSSAQPTVARKLGRSAASEDRISHRIPAPCAVPSHTAPDHGSDQAGYASLGRQTLITRGRTQAAKEALGSSAAASPPTHARQPRL